MTQPRNRVTRWCPAHKDEMVKRGTARCRRCTTDLRLPRRGRIVIPAGQIRTARAKGEPTKRANERRTKGYVS